MTTLAAKITPEIDGWSQQGYHPFPSETTRALLHHWFDRDEEQGDRFHDCQRRAIETIIYLHEVRKIRTLRQLYEEFCPEYLNLSLAVKEEADSIPFMKYCFKMATGSGKTWVLAAVVVWQYFNALNGESAAPSSFRFMVVTPGLEVRNRILDSFKGKRDHRGRRDPQTADYQRNLFIPDSPEWRGRFHLLNQVLEPADLRANAQPPDGPFVAITNWQQFRLDDRDPSLAEQYGLAIPEEPQGRIIAEFMTEHPDLIILNDEAHHVHGRKTARAEELVWRRFMKVLHDRIVERHAENRGLFLQVDFSATPFYGSANDKEFFPHIVYDYDLRNALNDQLVKQLFVEERTVPGGRSTLKDLDFRATRADAEKGRRGEVVSLSHDQKQILGIALAKLNQLTTDFTNKGINRKPVLMVLCEETTVADLVHDFLIGQENYKGDPFGTAAVLAFHSNLTKERNGYTLDDARGGRPVDLVARTHPTLDDIDDDTHPLQIVVSVLALREGFDKTNICVTAVLRATEADMLLEQIVGRGLRLMFPAYRYPELEDAKRQSFELLKAGEKPHNSLDFLYIVEHPRFRTFYDELRKAGYLIASGDSSDTTPTGDLLPVEAAADRVPRRDIAWPLAVHDETALPDITQIDAKSLPSSAYDFDQYRKTLQTLSVTDRHLETDTRADTWALRDKWFDYAHYLRKLADDIARDGRNPVLTARRAEIAALVDDYTTHRLFKSTIDFSLKENYFVLADPTVQAHVVNTIRATIIEFLGQPRYDVRRGSWKRLSDLKRIHVREEASFAARRCIYPRVGYPSRAGGLERDVMAELLEGSPEVEAWCRLLPRHGLEIAYRDERGNLRRYRVDFILRTADGCYILETKGDRDLTSPTVAIKARAAQAWCDTITGVQPPSSPVPSGDAPAPFPAQPTRWEYLLLSESLFKNNRGSSFAALLPHMRALRDQTIAQQFHGTLFAR